MGGRDSDFSGMTVKRDTGITWGLIPYNLILIFLLVQTTC